MESKTPLTDARIAKHSSCAGLNELAAHYNDLLDYARRLESALALAEGALRYIGKGYSGSGDSAEGHSGSHCAEYASEALRAIEKIKGGV